MRECDWDVETADVGVVVGCHAAVVGKGKAAGTVNMRIVFRSKNLLITSKDKQRLVRNSSIL